MNITKSARLCTHQCLSYRVVPLTEPPSHSESSLSIYHSGVRTPAWLGQQICQLVEEECRETCTFPPLTDQELAARCKDKDVISLADAAMDEAVPGQPIAACATPAQLDPRSATAPRRGPV